MSSRLRSLLPALALATCIFALAAVLPIVSVLTAEPDSAAAANVQRPKRKPATAKAPPPKPTLGERAATFAREAVGVPYRWGGSTPSGGFDCSGLVFWAYKRVGIDLPHSSYALYGWGRRVARSKMKPGDVLFFSGLGHVGLYLGRGRMVHAPYTGRRVEIVKLGHSHYGSRLVGARRVVPV